jgi:hypothetical protein
MLDFKPVPFRLPVAPPRVQRQAPRNSPELGQRFEQVLGWNNATGDSLRFVFHGTTAALGFHVWITDKGFWKYFGLFLGIGQTVGAICDAISLGKRIAGTHPPEGQ